MKKLKGVDLHHLPCPQGGLGQSLIVRADSGVTGYADTLAEHSKHSSLSCSWPFDL